MINALLARIGDKLTGRATIKLLQAEKRHLAYVAEWFCDNDGGTPVPEWCWLSWINGEPVVEPEDIAKGQAWADEIREALGKRNDQFSLS